MKTPKPPVTDPKPLQNPAHEPAVGAETPEEILGSSTVPPVVRLQQLEEENQDLRDQLLRGAAELENFRKRSQREQDEIRRFGIERVLRSLLPVLDNLDRAVAHASDSDVKGPLLDGVRMVAKQFSDALAAQGAVGFDSQGLPFNPERHEAVSRQPDAKAAPDTILVEVQRGYLLNGRLLRPAQVVVAVAPLN